MRRFVSSAFCGASKTSPSFYPIPRTCLFPTRSYSRGSSDSSSQRESPRPLAKAELDERGSRSEPIADSPSIRSSATVSTRPARTASASARNARAPQAIGRLAGTASERPASGSRVRRAPGRAPARGRRTQRMHRPPAPGGAPARHAAARAARRRTAGRDRPPRARASRPPHRLLARADAPPLLAGRTARHRDPRRSSRAGTPLASPAP